MTRNIVAYTTVVALSKSVVIMRSITIIIGGLFFIALGVEAQNVAWKSNETIWARYDDFIELPECRTNLTVSDCRFSKRWLGFSQYWNDFLKYQNVKPDQPSDTISCSPVISSKKSGKISKNIFFMLRMKKMRK